MPRRPRDPENPLVPIDPHAVRLALRVRGWSVYRLERESGVSHQALAHILHALRAQQRVVRCHRKTRTAIARGLKVRVSQLDERNVVLHGLAV